MSLYEEFLSHNGRLIHKWKHYFPAYERHFAPWQNKTVTFLEIGAGAGGSLQMWKRFFGPHATIIGVDNRVECKAYEEDQIHVRLGFQQDPKFLQSLIDEFGIMDVILDDGSHMMTDIKASFEFLYPKMPKNGVYAVEDLHTAYWPRNQGGLGRPGTFIEIAKSLIDDMHAEYTSGEREVSEFTKNTIGISFYDSLVFLERGNLTRKFAPKIGGSA